MEKKKLSVQDYARKCEVSRETIYNRIDSGSIIPEVFKGCYVIDIDKFPPFKRIKGGRPSVSH